ncbi:MAG: adenylosuccinate lyase [Bacteroidia bacterium]|nr:adenylosuccinate lyase [Bacteroidia bacterium]
MKLEALTAVSPVDGRYRGVTGSLAAYFSEFALIRYRIHVEVEYFIALCQLPLPHLKSFDHNNFPALRHIISGFTVDEAQKVKDIEKTTNHDVKAVEYYLKAKFSDLGLSEYREFIHFGLTSQDINNTAIPLSLKEGLEKVFYPVLEQVIDKLNSFSREWKDIPMLARTHGQPASPTRVGKEIRVFAERIEKQYGILKTIPFSAKFGGATGNFNAHVAAYPLVDWMQFADTFVNSTLKLERSQTTTQIDHYDNIAAIFDALKRINTIFTDMCRDFWTYISMNYFTQKINKDEVGSSAMPHKVNPIDFENAEGNLGVAIALFEHLSGKLPISRLQRDLTDSTVLRNIGVPIAHSLISLQSLLKGLGKISLNEAVIHTDLEASWSVVAEAIQTILRRENYPDPFEKLKELTRTGKAMNKNTFVEFIEGLDISSSVKEELLKITPFNYTGITSV